MGRKVAGFGHTIASHGARVAELVRRGGLKSCCPRGRVGSNPTPGMETAQGSSVRRRWLGMRSTAAAGAVAAFLLFPATAGAVLPKPGKSYTVHDHQTPGDNWHVELKINKTGRQIVGAVLHAERCG